MDKIPIANDLPANGTTLNDMPAPVAAAPRRWLSHATEPQILFPVIGVLVLAAIWGTTLNLIKAERAAAENDAAVSSRRMVETYEAQAVRALRDIDQTLKFVKYASELRGRQAVLQELKSRTLLPPDLLFTISIADGEGNVVASTRRAAMTNVAGHDYFQSQRRVDALSVGLPRKIPESGEWQLQFSRRLNAVEGSFSGIVIASVDAGYFVSGYESSELGKHGVLGVLGTDGIFRVRRSGETVTVGDMVDYDAVVPAKDEPEREATLATNPWDGVRRYTSVRRLYDFPLAVVVGLSADEQMADTRRDRHAYLLRAFAGSVALILIVSVMGRLSWQLALSRRRTVSEHIAYAARVEYVAYHDGLTTLPNRSLFSKLLGHSINQARRYNRQLAVLFFDLDQFKSINDTLGHESGDKLLQEVAIRIKTCLRESDTVARMGGDEFVALLPELGEEKYVVIVAKKILATVARPFILQGQECFITASIGISIYPQDGQDERTLERNADTAMYQVKKAGRNNFQFYSTKP